MLATAPAMADQAAVFTIGSSSYTINGQPYYMDVSPFVQDGRAYVPVRYLADSIGLIVAWNPKTQVVELSLNTDNAQLKTDVQMVINKNELWVNGNKSYMDVSPIIVDGRTMLPARWVAEAFDSNVTWDAGSQTVTISPNYHPAYISVPNVLPADQGNDQGAQSGIITPAYITPTPPTITPVIDIPANSQDDQDTITLPSLYPNVNFVNTYTWYYQDTKFKWTIGVPQDLIKKENSQSAKIPLKSIIYALTLHVKQMELDSLVYDHDTNEYISYVTNILHQVAKNQGYDKFHEAEFIATFVQYIPYLDFSIYEYPPQVIALGGVCEDKSVLLVSILRQLGYPVSILIYHDIAHSAVGIGFKTNEIPEDRYKELYLFTGLPAGMTCYTKNGINYYFMEVTQPKHIIGVSTLSTTKAPTVYEFQ
jgi:hypothetical protein